MSVVEKYFLKNGRGRHKMMTTPTKIHQFLIKLNEEALVKVSSNKLRIFLESITFQKRAITT